MLTRFFFVIASVLFAFSATAHEEPGSLVYVDANGYLHSNWHHRLSNVGFEVHDVVLYDNHLYWIETRDRGDGSWLVRADYDGSRAWNIRFTALDFRPHALAFDGRYVYVSANWETYRMPKDGGALQGLLRYGARAFDVRDGYIYWHEREGIFRRDASGVGNIKRLVYTNDCREIEVRGRYVYWSEGTAVWRCSVDGGRSERLYRTWSDIKSIAVSDRHIYIATWRDGVFTTDFNGHGRLGMWGGVRANKIAYNAGAQRPVRQQNVQWGHFR